MKLNGYLTIFLSLSLTVLLSLFFVLIRGAFVNYSKMKLELVTDIGMNAVLGEYHRELLNQYDLLFIDLSYGTNSGGINKLESHLAGYINQNLLKGKNNVSSWNGLALKGLEITETLKPHHYEGKVLKNQASAYISENLRAETVNDLSALLTEADSLDKLNEMVSWQNVMNKISSILAFLTNEARQQALSVNPEADVGDINITIDNPASDVFSNVSWQLDNLVKEDIKGGNVNLSNYYSHRNKESKSSENSPKANFMTEFNSAFLFRAYLFEKMSYHKNEKEDSLLDYQIEYLIAGASSDEENFQGIKMRLFSWRLADNVRLYFTDSQKTKEAYAIASTVSALILHPELTQLIASSLLFSWAFTDSINETDKITDGGKVPLIKKSLSLTEEGLLYHQYLELMILLTGEAKVLSRAMDIIEMDIRLTPNNQNFQIDFCLEAFRATVEFHDRYENYLLDRRYGY
ncbi:MAG: DUF5702 domain-containing protein [Lachnospiraceae bacterium]|nr:DUF5702 domain-containing protein [Lachnospiraceae bacterium]